LDECADALAAHRRGHGAVPVDVEDDQREVFSLHSVTAVWSITPSSSSITSR
jgi:hypothetical protein